MKEEQRLINANWLIQRLQKNLMNKNEVRRIILKINYEI